MLREDGGQFLFGVSYSQVQRGFPNNSLQVFAENYTQKTSPAGGNILKIIKKNINDKRNKGTKHCWLGTLGAKNALFVTGPLSIYFLFAIFLFYSVCLSLIYFVKNHAQIFLLVKICFMSYIITIRGQIDPSKKITNS